MTEIKAVVLHCKGTHSASFLTHISRSRMWFPINQTRLEK